MQPASCGVRLVTYVYKEPSTGAKVVARPSTREAFDVVKYASNAGLGNSIAVNILTVMNGPAAARCTAQVSARRGLVGYHLIADQSSLYRTVR